MNQTGTQTVYRELHPPTAVTHCVEAYFTHPASAAGKGVNAAAAAPPNLILGRGTRLEVYALNYGSGPCLSSSNSSSSSSSSSGNCRLELVGSFPCWGVVCGLSVLRGKGSAGQRDSIVVAVRDAKVSVVEWNADLHCLKNGSLHSYEKPELREGCPGACSIGAGSTLVSVPPLVATDPGGRCAAALLHGRLLAVLPAIQADVLELLVQQDKASSAACVGNSYTVNLAKVPSLKLTSATAVRALTFMHGFTQPLLVLLHETMPTWGARLKETRDACALSALSINVCQKRQPVIWSVQGLPSDACGLMAVPRGGVLVLSQNLLMYYAQGGSCVMAINSNAFAGEVPPKLDPPSVPDLPKYIRGDADKLQQAAAQSALEKATTAATSHAKQWAANVHPESVPAAARGAPKAPGLELEADGAVGTWVEDSVALLSLKTGQLLLVSLKFEGTAASKMQVCVVGSAPVASCAVRLTPSLLFFGSHVGDSLLIRATRDGVPLAPGFKAPAAALNPGEHPAKRRRLASLASFDMGGREGEGATPGVLPGPGGSSTGVRGSSSGGGGSGGGGVDGGGVDVFGVEGEWELYKSATGRSSSMKLPAPLGDNTRYSFKVLDSLMCLGPVRSNVVTDLHLCESVVHASLSGLSDHRARPSTCLLAAVGGDKSGALAILRQGVVADVITAVPNLRAHGAWTLHFRPTEDHEEPPAAAEGAAVDTSAAEPAAAAAAAAAAGDAMDTEGPGLALDVVGGTPQPEGQPGVSTSGGSNNAAKQEPQEQGGGDDNDAAAAAAAAGEGEGSDTAAAAAAGAADGAAGAGDGSGGGGGDAMATAPDTQDASKAEAAGPEAAAAEPAAAADAAAEAPEAAAATEAAAAGVSSHHAFLLLSCGGSQTMVLDARGSELAEVLQDVAYIRNAPTIAVGEMFDATSAVQVTHHTVRLIRGTADLLQELTLSDLLLQANHPAAAAVAAATAATGSNDGSNDTLALQSPVCIKYAQVRDPYVLLMLSDSTVLLLQGYRQQQQQQQQQRRRRQRRLQLLSAALPQLAEAGWAVPQGAATAACLYTDSSGWLTAAAGVHTSSTADQQQQQPQQQQEQQEEEDAGDDVDTLMAEAAAAAPAAGEEDQAAAAGADAAGAAAAAAGKDVDMPDAEDPSGAKQQQQQQQESSGAGGGGVSKPDMAQGAAAAAANAAAPKRPPLTRHIPGLFPATAAAAAGGGGGLDDDGDGVAPAGEAAAAKAAQTAAAAEAAAAAHAAAAAAGATDRGRAIAGSKAFDQALDSAAAAAAAAGGQAAAAGGSTSQQQQQGLDSSSSLQTPFQLAAAAGIEDGSLAAAPAGTQQQQEAGVCSYVCVVRAGGGVQVFALPHMQCVFEDDEAVLGHQVLSPARPPSLYDEDVSDAELDPSPISEVIMECFSQPSGGAAGVAAAAAPLLIFLRDHGALLAYKAYKPYNGKLGFRQLPLGPAVLGHESPAPPAAATAAAAVSGIQGMPAADTPPTRLARFDHLATPRLDPPLGPGFKPPGGPNPTDSLAGSDSGLRNPGGLNPGPPLLHYSGVFVCGPKPLWLVATRGGLVVHPMDGVSMGAVDAFCGFHNVNCPHGYIAAALEGDMRVCTLPLQLRLDQPWLCSKLPLRSTPLALTVYPEAHLLALATSRLSAPPRPFLPAEPGGDPVSAAAYATADAAAKAAGVEELNEVLLLAPPGFGLRMNTYVSVAGALAAAAAMAAAGSNAAAAAAAAAEGGVGSAAGSAARVAAAVAAAAGWAGLPLWRHSLLPGEDVTSLKCIELQEGGSEAPQSYIAVACASAYGEDYPALGRVLLLQVVKQHVFNMEGGSQTKVTARLALQHDLPGPVMAVESLRGFLILAVGFRVEMHYKQGNTLVKMGQFLDVPSLVTGLSIVKDFMLVGTAAHSGHFMRYKEGMDKFTQEKNQNMVPLSADVARVESWSVDFLVIRQKLLAVVADGGGNISVMQYDKNDPDSWGGQKLLRRGVAHTGGCVSCLSRMRLSTPDGSNRQGLLAATAQGGLLLLAPFWDEAMFRRMTSLYEELVYRLQHTAGLNPKAFQARYARAGPAYGSGFYPIEPLKPSANGLLQGDVLMSFVDLDQRSQAAIAMAVGCDVGDLLDDLQALAVADNLL